MRQPLQLLSSMATRPLLAELADSYRQTRGIEVHLESVGGVDAARRVQAGEVFDLVVLAGDAVDTLIAAQRLQVDSRRAIADSAVAIAVRAGAPRPDVRSEAALRHALLDARSIGYSTGPSGTALLRLFQRWELADLFRARLIQARPGVPVGRLVASGEAEIGFQQFSELMSLDGIDVLGGMPPGTEIVTTFVGALGVGSVQPDQARELLNFFCQPATAALKKRHGMSTPAP